MTISISCKRFTEKMNEWMNEWMIVCMAMGWERGRKKKLVIDYIVGTNIFTI